MWWCGSAADERDIWNPSQLNKYSWIYIRNIISIINIGSKYQQENISLLSGPINPSYLNLFCIEAIWLCGRFYNKAPGLYSFPPSHTGFITTGITGAQEQLRLDVLPDTMVTERVSTQGTCVVGGHHKRNWLKSFQFYGWLQRYTCFLDVMKHQFIVTSHYTAGCCNWCTNLIGCAIRWHGAAEIASTCHALPPAVTCTAS